MLQNQYITTQYPEKYQNRRFDCKNYITHDSRNAAEAGILAAF